MEKLIKLLNEYDGTPLRWTFDNEDEIYLGGERQNYKQLWTTLCDRSYWFFEFLIEEWHICLKRLNKRREELFDEEPEFADEEKEDLYKLYMILSISYNKIDDLIELLK